MSIDRVLIIGSSWPCKNFFKCLAKRATVTRYSRKVIHVTKENNPDIDDASNLAELKS